MSTAKIKSKAKVAPATSMTIEGWGIGIQWIGVNKKIFTKLTAKGITRDELDELFEDADSMAGPTNGCSLCFDNGESKEINLPEPNGGFLVGRDAKYLLINEEARKGIWSKWEFEDGYDEDSLDLSIDCHRLNDGTSYLFLEIWYDDDDGSSWLSTTTKSSNVFALTKDGKRHQVILLDD